MLIPIRKTLSIESVFRGRKSSCIPASSKHIKSQSPCAFNGIPLENGWSNVLCFAALIKFMSERLLDFTSSMAKAKNKYSLGWKIVMLFQWNCARDFL